MSGLLELARTVCRQGSLTSARQTDSVELWHARGSPHRMPLHDTANFLAKPQHDPTAVARRKASLLKKQRQLRRELRSLQETAQKDLALLERERQELRDGRLNAAASRAAKKGLAQKPRSSRDRAEFDARTLKVEAPRAEQAAKRAEARCSLALKRLAVARERLHLLPGDSQPF